MEWINSLWSGWRYIIWRNDIAGLWTFTFAYTRTRLRKYTYTERILNDYKGWSAVDKQFTSRHRYILGVFFLHSPIQTKFIVVYIILSLGF